MIVSYVSQALVITFHRSKAAMDIHSLGNAGFPGRQAHEAEFQEIWKNHKR